MATAPFVLVLVACIFIVTYSLDERVPKRLRIPGKNDANPKAEDTLRWLFDDPSLETSFTDMLYRELDLSTDFSMSMPQEPTSAEFPTAAPTVASSTAEDLVEGCKYFGNIQISETYVELSRGEFLCTEWKLVPERLFRFGVDETGLLSWWGVSFVNGKAEWTKLWDVGIDAANRLVLFAFGRISLYKDTVSIVWEQGCSTNNGLYVGFEDGGPVLRELVSDVDPGYPRVMWKLSGRNAPSETDFCRWPPNPDKCVSSLAPGDVLNVNEFICNGRYRWGVSSSGKVEHWYQLNSCCSSHVAISSLGGEGQGNYVIAQLDGNVVQYDESGTVLWRTGCSSSNLQAYVTIEAPTGDPSTSFGTVTVKDKCGHELWESGRDYVYGYCDPRSTQTDYGDCRGRFLFPGQALEQGAAICRADLAFGLGQGNDQGRLGQYEDGFEEFGLYRTPGGWDSEANGQRLVMQESDGNLVLYDNGSPTWATGCLIRTGTAGKHILWKNQATRGTEVYNNDSCEVVWRIFQDTNDMGESAMFESQCYPDDPGN